MTDLTSQSYSELREAAKAIEREVARREAMDQTAREEAFRAELTEVKAGTRRVDS